MRNVIPYISDLGQKTGVVREYMVRLIGWIDHESNVLPNLGSVVPREPVALSRTV